MVFCELNRGEFSPELRYLTRPAVVAERLSMRQIQVDVHQVAGSNPSRDNQFYELILILAAIHIH